jgi:predicted Fe-Mo cluster-binding NifX family protein
VLELKIGITAEKNSKESMVAMHFGNAPYVALIDLEKDEMEFIHLGYEHHMHELGNKLKKRRIEAFITWSMGPHAAEVFIRNGIKLYQVPKQVSIEEALNLYEKGSLIKFSYSGTPVPHRLHDSDKPDEKGVVKKRCTLCERSTDDSSWSMELKNIEYVKRREGKRHRS